LQLIDFYCLLFRFLLQSLEDLDKSLQKFNSRLFVIRGQPADVLPSLFKEWKTNYFSFEVDPEPFGKIGTIKSLLCVGI
ncbi:Uncharacterized protein FKW44_007181, partial [Caligus rogercresseyi]